MHLHTLQSYCIFFRSPDKAWLYDETNVYTYSVIICIYFYITEQSWYTGSRQRKQCSVLCCGRLSTSGWCFYGYGPGQNIHVLDWDFLCGLEMSALSEILTFQWFYLCVIVRLHGLLHTSWTVECLDCCCKLHWYILHLYF